MSESVFLQAIGPGGCLVLALILLWCFMDGKLHTDKEFSKLEQENFELRAALNAERQAVNETAKTSQFTNQLLSALTTMAQDRLPVPEPPRLEASGDDR